MFHLSDLSVIFLPLLDFCSKKMLHLTIKKLYNVILWERDEICIKVSFYSCHATNKNELEPMKIKLMACCCVNHSHRVHAMMTMIMMWNGGNIVDEKPKIGGQWWHKKWSHAHTHKKLTFWCILIFSLSLSLLVIVAACTHKIIFYDLN